MTPSHSGPHDTAEAGSPGPLGTPPRDVVVIGTSAGGVEALQRVLTELPADYPGTVCVVLHIPPAAPSVLAQILGRATRLTCLSAYDRAPVRPGVVYVAPPDWHLVLEPGEVRLVRGPRENNHRPAVDPLFRSAARAYGPRAVGVVLTGNLDDGTRGLLAIKAQGGLAVVQSPGDALFTGMPLSAIGHVPVDYVLDCREIGALLGRVAGSGRPPTAPRATARGPERQVPAPGQREEPAMRDVPDDRPDGERLTAPFRTDGTAHTPAAATHVVERDAGLETGVGVVDEGRRINERLGGVVSGYTCPECRGSLWEINEDGLLRYRCRVGHAYTEAGLVEFKGRAVEDALWTALTALEESAAIAARVADRASEAGRERSAAQFRERAERLERRGAVLRDVLGELPRHEAPTEASDEAPDGARAA